MNEITVGDKVRLLNDIWDDGEEHHPPGWLAWVGEILEVKEVRTRRLVVSHVGNEGGFVVYDGEYERVANETAN